MTEYPEGLLNDIARQLISIKARQLLRKTGLHSQDHSDLAQELALRLLHKLRNFDANRGRLAAFLHLALKSIAANLLRDHWQRQCIRFVSLRPHDGSARADEWLGTLLDAGEGEDRQRRHQARTDQGGLDAKIDVADIVARLPPALRVLAEDLLLGKPLAQVARERDVPRSTLQGHLRRLRKFFENKDFF